jgi:hypothetical protein
MLACSKQQGMLHIYHHYFPNHKLLLHQRLALKPHKRYAPHLAQQHHKALLAMHHVQGLQGLNVVIYCFFEAASRLIVVQAFKKKTYL